MGYTAERYNQEIAATALSHGYPVLTGNLNEFRRVPGLEVVAAE